MDMGYSIVKTLGEGGNWAEGGKEVMGDVCNTINHKTYKNNDYYLKFRKIFNCDTILTLKQ